MRVRLSFFSYGRLFPFQCLPLFSSQVSKTLEVAQRIEDATKLPKAGEQPIASKHNNLTYRSHPHISQATTAILLTLTITLTLLTCMPQAPKRG